MIHLRFKSHRSKRGATKQNTVILIFIFTYGVTFTSVLYFFVWLQVALKCPLILA